MLGSGADMTDCGSRGRAGRLGLVLGLVLLVAGCGSDSNTGTPTTPSGTATVRLVPPAGCTPGCASSALASVQVNGPLGPVGPFGMNFGIVSILPFAAPGTYVVTGATFLDSTGAAGGCPDASFAAANDKTTTVTFSITNDVCRIAVSGPA